MCNHRSIERVYVCVLNDRKMVQIQPFQLLFYINVESFVKRNGRYGKKMNGSRFADKFIHLIYCTLFGIRNFRTELKIPFIN